VRLDARNKNFPHAAVLKIIEYFRTTAATESQLGRDGAESLGQFRRGCAKALGILLRGRHGQAKDFRPVDQPPYVPCNPSAGRNRGKQFFLHVNNQKPRIAGRH
jgi:hypothetical protein